MSSHIAGQLHPECSNIVTGDLNTLSLLPGGRVVNLKRLESMLDAGMVAYKDPATVSNVMYILSSADLVPSSAAEVAGLSDHPIAVATLTPTDMQPSAARPSGPRDSLVVLSAAAATVALCALLAVVIRRRSARGGRHDGRAHAGVEEEDGRATPRNAGSGDVPPMMSHTLSQSPYHQADSAGKNADAIDV